ncbi:MAG: hypothetical protein ABIH11_07615 [Candidatus Altiarchaeota archaeon]
MANANKNLARIAILSTIIVVWHVAIDSKTTVYVGLIGFLALIILMNADVMVKPRIFYESWRYSSKDGFKARLKKSMEGVDEASMGSRERRLLSFYILGRLEKSEMLDTSEIAAELDVSIYTLNEILESLRKHKVIELTYPQMEKLPFITKVSKSRSVKLRNQIFESMTEKNMLRDNKKKFAEELNRYIKGIRR